MIAEVVGLISQPPIALALAGVFLVTGFLVTRLAFREKPCSPLPLPARLFRRLHHHAAGCRGLALAFDALLAGLGERPACRVMVGILALAFERSCEAELALALQAALDDGVLPDLAVLIERFRPKDAALPVVVVRLPSLAIYDQIATSVGEAA